MRRFWHLFSLMWTRWSLLACERGAASSLLVTRVSGRRRRRLGNLFLEPWKAGALSVSLTTLGTGAAMYCPEAGGGSFRFDGCEALPSEEAISPDLTFAPAPTATVLGAPSDEMLARLTGAPLQKSLRQGGLQLADASRLIPNSGTGVNLEDWLKGNKKPTAKLPLSIPYLIPALAAWVLAAGAPDSREPFEEGILRGEIRTFQNRTLIHTHLWRKPTKEWGALGGTALATYSELSPERSTADALVYVSNGVPVMERNAEGWKLLFPISEEPPWADLIRDPGKAGDGFPEPPPGFFINPRPPEHELEWVEDGDGNHILVKRGAPDGAVWGFRARGALPRSAMLTGGMGFVPEGHVVHDGTVMLPLLEWKAPDGSRHPVSMSAGTMILHGVEDEALKALFFAQAEQPETRAWLTEQEVEVVTADPEPSGVREELVFHSSGANLRRRAQRTSAGVERELRHVSHPDWSPREFRIDGQLVKYHPVEGREPIRPEFPLNRGIKTSWGADVGFSLEREISVGEVDDSLANGGTPPRFHDTLDLLSFWFYPAGDGGLRETRWERLSLPRRREKFPPVVWPPNDRRWRNRFFPRTETPEWIRPLSPDELNRVEIAHKSFAPTIDEFLRNRRFIEDNFGEGLYHYNVGFELPASKAERDRLLPALVNLAAFLGDFAYFDSLASRAAVLADPQRAGEWVRRVDSNQVRPWSADSVEQMVGGILEGLVRETDSKAQAVALRIAKNKARLEIRSGSPGQGQLDVAMLAALWLKHGTVEDFERLVWPSRPAELPIGGTVSSRLGLAGAYLYAGDLRNHPAMRNASLKDLQSMLSAGQNFRGRYQNLLRDPSVDPEAVANLLSGYFAAVGIHRWGAWAPPTGAEPPLSKPKKQGPQPELHERLLEAVRFLKTKDRNVSTTRARWFEHELRMIKLDHPEFTYRREDLKTGDILFRTRLHGSYLIRQAGTFHSVSLHPDGTPDLESKRLLDIPPMKPGAAPEMIQAAIDHARSLPFHGATRAQDLEVMLTNAERRHPGLGLRRYGVYSEGTGTRDSSVFTLADGRAFVVTRNGYVVEGEVSDGLVHFSRPTDGAALVDLHWDGVQEFPSQRWAQDVNLWLGKVNLGGDSTVHIDHVLHQLRPMDRAGRLPMITPQIQAGARRVLQRQQRGGGGEAVHPLFRPQLVRAALEASGVAADEIPADLESTLLSVVLTSEEKAALDRRLRAVEGDYTGFPAIECRYAVIYQTLRSLDRVEDAVALYLTEAAFRQLRDLGVRVGTEFDPAVCMP